MVGQAEVRLTLRTSDYQLLQAMLKYQAHQITADDMMVMLKAQGYPVEREKLDMMVARIAEQLTNVIK